MVVLCVTRALRGGLVLTDTQSAAGAHGAARLRPVLGDGGDADGTAEAGAALLNTDVLD